MITMKSIPLRTATHPRPALPDPPARRRRSPHVVHRLAVQRAARRRRAMARRNLAMARRLGHVSAATGQL